MHSLLTLAALAVLPTGALAQSTPLQLATGFSVGGAFTSGAPDLTIYFDLDVSTRDGITLFEIEHHMNVVPGTEREFALRVVSGPGATYVGNETDAAFWPADPVVEGTLVSGGPGAPSPGEIPGGLFLARGPHTIAITYPEGQAIYQTTPRSPVPGPGLTLDAGSVSPGFLAPPFGGSGARFFQGALRYYLGNVPVASAVEFGEECPQFHDASLVFEELSPASGNPSDLSGSEIVFTPNGTGGYVVTGSSSGSNFAPPGPAAIALGTGLSGPIPLTNPVTGPDGTPVQTIEVDDNGRVLFETGSNVATPGGPTVQDLLNSVPSVQIGAAHDLSVGGALTFEEVGTDIVVTWNDVPEFGQTNRLTTQIVLNAGGVIRLRLEDYRPVAVSVVGISQGVGFADFAETATPTDLSGTFVTPLDTGTSRIGVVASPIGRPVIGASLDLRIDQLPQTATAVALLVGFVPLGIDLSVLGAPGCVLVSSSEATLPVTGIPTGVGMVSSPLPNRAGLQGLTVFAQALAVDPQAGNPFGISLGNGVRATLELQ